MEGQKMNIVIARTEDGKESNIYVAKNYTDIKDIGEVCHFLAELEIIKNDLLEIFEEMNGFKEVNDGMP